MNDPVYKKKKLIDDADETGKDNVQNEDPVEGIIRKHQR